MTEVSTLMLPTETTPRDHSECSRGPLAPACPPSGIVILMLDAKMESGVAKAMIKGAPDTMYSEFHLGYNMLLNLLRMEGSEPEQLMAASFRQFQVSLIAGGCGSHVRGT